MTRSTLTYVEWQALSDAEAPLYANQTGLFPYTDVNSRDDASPFIVSLWTHAEDYVEPEDFDAQERIEEIARRVAHALAVLAFGPEFAAEKGAQS